MRNFLVCLLSGLILLTSCNRGPQQPEETPEPPVVVQDQPTVVAEVPPIPTATPMTPILPTTTMATTKMAIQAVAGPEYRYALVSRLEAGVPVPIVGRNRNGTWLQVDIDGAPSWVAHWALEYDPAETQELSPVDPAEPIPREMRRERMSSTRPPLEFGYGIQAHLIGVNIEQAMVATRNLGFNWLKQQVRWNVTEPENDVYRWNDLDLIVDRATYSDIHLLFSVVTSPEWARETGFDDTVDGPPSNPADLASFLQELAGRYCGTSLRAIEVWNEQNLYYEWGNLPLSAEDYVSLLAQASTAIRDACPSMYIVSGALTPAGSISGVAVDDFQYLERMMIAGAAQHVDAIGAHPSGYNVPAKVIWDDACAAIIQYGNSFNGACDSPHHSWSFRSTMEGYRSILQTFGVTLPIWPTEFGWAAGGAFHPDYGYANDNSYAEQADWTVDAYQMMKDWGWVAPPILWNLNFRVIADRTERAQWGIVNNNWSPLPVYEALQDLEK